MYLGTDYRYSARHNVAQNVSERDDEIWYSSQTNRYTAVPNQTG